MNKTLKQTLIFSGLDVLAVIVVIFIFALFFLIPLQTQILEANKVISENANALQQLEENDLEGIIDTQQSLESYHQDILKLSLTFFAIATLIFALFSSYSWYKSIKSKVPYGHFLLRFIAWNAIWFGVGVGIFLTVLSIITYRDLLVISLFYDALMILGGIIFFLILGYVWLHSLAMLGKRKIIPALHKKHITIKRYLISFAAIAILIIVVTLLPKSGWLFGIGFILFVLLYNYLKIYINSSRKSLYRTTDK
jgi:hypothetical protein